MQDGSALWHHANYVKVRTDAAVCRAYNAYRVSTNATWDEDDHEDDDAGRVIEEAEQAPGA
jgi:hypothetical protein